MAAEGRKQSPADRGDTLLERERELAAIDALTGVAVAGSGRVVLIEGPPGIGKSRLLAEAASRAGAQGLQVLTARSSELEREFAFGIVRQLFEAILVRPDARRRWLSGSAGVAAPVFESLGVEADADHPDPSFATLHGLYWLTVNVATDRPLVLSIDDIQWCDQPSTRFLAYLAHRLDGLPVLIAVGHRTAAVEAELVLLEEIARAAVTTSIHPAPFSEVAVQTVVRERLRVDPDPAFAAACRQVTGGNPFLVRELLRALEAESVPPDAAHVDAIRYLGPRAVSRTVLLRLARLPAEGIAVARAAAVLGDGAGLAAISGLTGLDAQQVADTTRSLVDADVLRPEPPLGFVHPLVQAAIYHGLTPAERELVHARAARLLVESGAEDERVAAHLLAIPAGAEPWGIEVLRKAGRTALLKGGPESAISYFRRALDHGPVTEVRAELLLELGMAEALINAPAATEHLEAARNALSDPVARGRVARVLAQIMIFTRPPAEAVAVVEEAVAELPSEHGDLRQALEATGFYAVDFGAPEADAASGLARARQRVVGDGPGARMLQAVAAWDLALSGGSAADSVGLAQSALAGGVLVAADPAFTTLVATSVLALADRDE
ncbi:MAG: AAA family ATPase, partial [Candidatus Dormiibacterota bacterium]